MLLADPKVLRGYGKYRTMSMDPLSVPQAPDGTVKGRTADGVAFTATIGGKSLARRLMEEQAAKEAEKNRHGN